MARKSKKVEKVAQEVNVQIAVLVYPAETLFLRVYAGEAESDGKKWELSTSAAGGQPIVRLPDGRYVTFGWEAMVQAANLAGEPQRRRTR